MDKRARIPGFERLAAHVGDLRGGWVLLIPLVFLTFLAAATAAFIAIDRQGPFWAAVAELAAFGFVILWTGQVIWRRQAYRARWGELAYRNAFALHVLPGMPVVVAAIAHIAYLPGPRIAFGPAALPVLVLAVALLVSAAVLWIRSMWTFGVDNLSLLYVYFPEESRLVDASIYSVIRHPVYSAASQVCLGLGLWRGTWLSVAFGLFAPLGLTVWLRLAEERELIERFGESYGAYRRTVPAFYPRVRDWGKFFRFLLTGR